MREVQVIHIFYSAANFTS